MPRLSCATLAALLALGCREDAPPTAPHTQPALNVTAQVLGASQVSAGLNHTCALTDAGVAYCWGSNNSGQLGDGTTTDRTRPVRVAGGLTFRRISAGFNHTCGITTANRAYCWGDNHRGKLGDGTSDNERRTPVAVASGLSFRSVNTGEGHTCAVTTGNVAYCWGTNIDGQLGIGTADADAHPRPVRVAGALAFAVVSAGGGHSCGVTTGHVPYCWGWNGNGQLGDGTMTSRASPTRVAGGLLLSQAAAGRDHSCGATTSATGNVGYCWGYNTSGQLGIGTNAGPESCFDGPCSTRPVRVVGGLTFRFVNAGFGVHTCALTTGNVPYCWGNNRVGQLGDGTTTDRTRPVRVLSKFTFRQVGAGAGHSCGVTRSNVAYCWGANSNGQLGDGTTTDRTRPVAVASPAP